MNYQRCLPTTTVARRGIGFGTDVGTVCVVASVADYIGQAVPIPGSSKAESVFKRISSADIRLIEEGHRTVDDFLDKFEMKGR
ncbi:hypothetical protein IAS59_004153 [Cryptococcus gattii]